MRVPGAQMKARYERAIIGTVILMKGRYCFVRSMIGDVIAALTRPTRMSTAPAMPEVVSEKPYGVMICVRREEMELKKPT